MSSAALVIFFSALFGLAVGSFLNVLIDRLPAGRSIINGRSQCDVCGHALRPWDLVPIASYLLLGGKCRYCGAPIPRRIVVVEAVTGLLYAFAAWQLGYTVDTAITMGFISILLVMFVIDMEHHLILDVVTYPSIVFALAVAPWGPIGLGLRPLKDAYLDAFYGASLAGAVLLLIYVGAMAVMHKEALGLGDVKLGIALGLMMGFIPTVVALNLAFVGGGLLAVVLLVRRVRRTGEYISFGPFLAGAGIVSLFWGQRIYDWYASLFP